MTITETVDTVVSLARRGRRLIPPIVVLGLFFLMFGGPTYANIQKGNYVEAALGGIVLAVIGIVCVWWLYRRVQSEKTGATT